MVQGDHHGLEVEPQRVVDQVQRTPGMQFVAADAGDVGDRPAARQVQRHDGVAGAQESFDVMAVVEIAAGAAVAVLEQHDPAVRAVAVQDIRIAGEVGWQRDRQALD